MLQTPCQASGRTKLAKYASTRAATTAPGVIVIVGQALAQLKAGLANVLLGVVCNGLVLDIPAGTCESWTDEQLATWQQQATR